MIEKDRAAGRCAKELADRLADHLASASHVPADLRALIHRGSHARLSHLPQFICVSAHSRSRHVDSPYRLSQPPLRERVIRSHQAAAELAILVQMDPGIDEAARRS